MEYKCITYEREAPLGMITLNRPDVLNAINDEMAYELIDVLTGLETDNEVRAVIITGAGKAFMAGGDITLMERMNTPEALEWGRLVYRVLDRIYQLPQPTIAAVNGAAIGGGFELAMACDLLVASIRAKFAQPELNLGIIPGAGSTQRLPRLIGATRAKGLILLGENLTAEQALQLGIVNRAVEAELLLTEARQMAQKVAGLPRRAVQTAKRAINLAERTDLGLGLQCEIELYAFLYSTQDQKEGMKAFLEKRSPEFKHI